MMEDMEKWRILVSTDDVMDDEMIDYYLSFYYSTGQLFMLIVAAGW